MQEIVAEQPTESKESARSNVTPSRFFAYGVLLFLVCAYLFTHVKAFGPIGSAYEPAYETLEEVEHSKPQWFSYLRDGLISHERAVVGESYSFGIRTTKLYRQKKWDAPEAFAVPASWLVAVNHAPGLKPEEVQELREIIQSEDYLTTSMAAQWLVGVGERLDKEAAEEVIRAQKAIILEQKSMAEKLTGNAEPAPSTQR